MADSTSFSEAEVQVMVAVIKQLGDGGIDTERLRIDLGIEKKVTARGRLFKLRQRLGINPKAGGGGAGKAAGAGKVEKVPKVAKATPKKKKADAEEATFAVKESVKRERGYGHGDDEDDKEEQVSPTKLVKTGRGKKSPVKAAVKREVKPDLVAAAADEEESSEDEFVSDLGEDA